MSHVSAIWVLGLGYCWLTSALSDELRAKTKNQPLSHTGFAEHCAPALVQIVRAFKFDLSSNLEEFLSRNDLFRIVRACVQLAKDLIPGIVTALVNKPSRTFRNPS